jgi:hypothetical protein
MAMVGLGTPISLDKAELLLSSSFHNILGLHNIKEQYYYTP